MNELIDGDSAKRLNGIVESRDYYQTKKGYAPSREEKKYSNSEDGICEYMTTYGNLAILYVYSSTICTCSAYAV